MGMSGGSGPSGFGTLNEINVTPLVDVMLVLLTIFMVASSVETIQVQREHEKMVRERSSEEAQLHMLHRIERLQQQEHVLAVSQHRQQRQKASEEHLGDRLRDMEEKLLDSSQNVPVDLPKTTSEAVNLAEERKLVLTFTADRELFVGDTKVLSCRAPEFREKALAAMPGQGVKIDEAKVEQAMFRECLGAIETKLMANVKLQEDKECYLRADRKLDYGDVLVLMATIRKAGVTRFGLVAEEP